MRERVHVLVFVCLSGDPPGPQWENDKSLVCDTESQARRGFPRP